MFELGIVSAITFFVAEFLLQMHDIKMHEPKEVKVNTNLVVKKKMWKNKNPAPVGAGNGIQK